MTDEEIMSIRNAAQDKGDTSTYNTAWVALGYWRHPAFVPATADERATAIRMLARRAAL
jgi:hypothetical protein